MSDQKTTWTFDAPAGVHFSCTQCGDCCRSLRILLGPGEPERLAALDWSGRAEDLLGAKTLEPSGDPAHPGRLRLAQRDDGACVYLGERNQCRIHEHFGGEVKPLVCRQYPFGFRTCGERVQVDVAFSCKSVSEGSGEAVTTRVAEWTTLLRESGAPQSPPPRLTTSQKLSPEVAREIEQRLVAFLDDLSLGLPERVRCALEFLRLATTGDAGAHAAAMLRDAIARGLPARIAREPLETSMDPTQRTVFRQWLFLALNPVPSRWEKLPRAQREAATREWQDKGLTFRDGLGRPWIDNAEIGASFADVDAVDASFLRGACEPLATFLRAKIVGERFLAAGSRELPLIKGARILFLCYPMAVWTSKALAAARGASAVEEADVRGATRLLDRTLGHLATSLLAKKQAKAFEWVMQDTDLVAAATHDVLA